MKMAIWMSSFDAEKKIGVEPVGTFSPADPAVVRLRQTLKGIFRPHSSQSCCIPHSTGFCSRNMCSISFTEYLLVVIRGMYVLSTYQ